MQQSEHGLVHQAQHYRPSCPKCGTQMMLARIEPAAEPGHDLRTFDCARCGHNETETVKYQ